METVVKIKTNSVDKNNCCRVNIMGFIFQKLKKNNSKLSINESTISQRVGTLEKKNCRMTLNCCLAIFSSCLAAFSLGTTLGYSSPAGPKMLNTYFNHHLISTDQKSWFDGVASLGAAFSGSLTAIIVSFIGFKNSLICCSLCYIFGWMLVTYASGLSLLLTGRVFTGFAAGMTTFLSPVYIAELSPPHLRGSLGTCFQLSLTSGVLFSYTAGTFLSWEWLACVNSFFPLALFFLMLFMPETPRWLLRNKYKLGCMKVLLWLRGEDANIDDELWKIETFLSQEKKFSLTDLRFPNIYKPILIILPLMALQQFSGINAITFNTVDLFKTTTPYMDPHLASIILVLSQLVIIVLSIFLMDKLGRRILLLLSATFMTVAISIFGLYLQELYKNLKLSWLPLTCLLIYILAFSFGFGPTPFIIMAEIIPNNIRTFASGMCLFINWLSSFTVTREFIFMQKSLSRPGTYWFFGSCSFLSIVFVWIFVPETKGKSLDEICKLFVSKQKKCLSISETTQNIEIPESAANPASHLSSFENEYYS